MGWCTTTRRGSARSSVSTARDRSRLSARGLGIPTEEQSRVFEKFYRVDPQMTRGVGGTGLGLYICNELVSRMGGHIWLESKAGEGSTFLFELPAAAPIAAPRPAELGPRSENVTS